MEAAETKPVLKRCPFAFEKVFWSPSKVVEAARSDEVEKLYRRPPFEPTKPVARLEKVVEAADTKPVEKRFPFAFEKVFWSPRSVVEAARSDEVAKLYRRPPFEPTKPVARLEKVVEAEETKPVLNKFPFAFEKVF